MLLLTACSTPRKVQQEQRQHIELQERIGAEWRDSLRITFHDVVILAEAGTETGAPPIHVAKIARVEVERKSEARVDAAAEEVAETEAKREEAPQSESQTWKWILAIGGFLMFLNFIGFKKV